MTVPLQGPQAALPRRTTQHVPGDPQQELAQSLASYPFDIKGAYRSAYFEIEEDFAGTDTAKLREICRRLGTDDLYA